MIHERLEAEAYLSGENIVKDNLYRILILIAKYCREQHLTPLQSREAIFCWANRNHIHIPYDVNAIITKVQADPTSLREVAVAVGKGDLDEIRRRFDGPKTRLVALAVLCYAKASENCDFTLSSVALGAWLGIHGSNIRRKYLKELLDFGYIEKLSTPQNNYKWTSRDENKSCRYRLLVPLDPQPLYPLIGNNIQALCDEVF